MIRHVQQGPAAILLLATKYRIPPVRPGLVARPRLLECLHQGLSGRVTIVSAPAGFGKTTLLCQWRQQNDLPVAWLSLDEGDDDLVRFWSYVITALQTVDPALGRDSLAMLHAPLSARVPIESVLTKLVNELDTGLRDRIVLVLDDFHLVRARPTLDALTFLISHLPQQLHLVLSGRSDPVLPLGRLRATSEIAELRAADLRFRPEEVRQFFDAVMGLTLPAEQITVLEQTSEGWVAGMQLAGLSMRGRNETADSARSFTGSNRYVIEYLVEEVLHQQPEDVQSFLLQTSVLDRMTASLCNKVAPAHDGRAMLEYLDKGNLFVTALDDERCCYRYHRLFAEFLRHHLWRKEPALVPVLQLRAAEWCEENGLIEEGLELALAARDFAKAASLLNLVAKDTLLAGDIPRLLGWLDALPEEMLTSRPSLRLIAAWALMVQGQARRAEQILSDLEGKLDSSDGFMLGSIAAIRANLACLRGAVHEALDLSYHALDLLPPDSLAERGAVLAEMGCAHSYGGDLSAAGKSLFAALAVNEEAGNRVGSVFALSNLASVQIGQGNLREAATSCNRALQLAVGASGASLPYASMASLILAAVSYEWNDLPEAERQANAGLAFGRQWGLPAREAAAQIHLARLAMANGDGNGAEKGLLEADDLVRMYNLNDIVPLLSASRLRLLGNRGQVETSGLLSRERGVDLGDKPDSAREAEYLALAWLTILAALRRHHTSSLWQVAAQLEGASQRAEAEGRIGSLIETRAVWSLASYAMGESAKATIVLEGALALAEPERFVRTFVDLGPVMGNLLGHAASRGVARDYIATLLEAFAEDAGARDLAQAGDVAPKPSPLSSVRLVEALSEREMEVLRLVANGRSNQEIADSLILAVGTVKRHLNNIFGKLGAQSRIQAVARARDLDLI